MGSESTEHRKLSFFSSQLISTQVSQKVSALNLLMCLMYFIFIPSKKAEKMYVAVLLSFGNVVQEKKKATAYVYCKYSNTWLETLQNKKESNETGKCRLKLELKPYEASEMA